MNNTLLTDRTKTRRLLEKTQINHFIQKLSGDKNAFELFKSEAKKTGMLKIPD